MTEVTFLETIAENMAECEDLYEFRLNAMLLNREHGVMKMREVHSIATDMWNDFWLEYV
jgi:hypothetical protein